MPSDDTRRGRADHRAVELFERMARVAVEDGRTVQQCERLITACVVADAARTWWGRRGYAMPPDGNQSGNSQEY